MFSFICLLALIDAVIVFTIFFITSVAIAYVWRKIFPKKKEELMEIMEEEF